ncbi:MAG: fatty acyl-AMP ligase [Phaeodactylibacter sp.]|nr:fatty acyl-AMP ligase [Phaeodactylibacter sp.]
MKQAPGSLVDILGWRAKRQTHKLSYRFLLDGETEACSISYGELDARARSIGAQLQACSRAGDRVLLLLPTGLDFIAAFFGCLYAKVIVIPVPPPHPGRLEKSMPSVLRIAKDAGPVAAILDASLASAIQVHEIETVAPFLEMHLLVPDEEQADTWASRWQPPDLEKEDVAFLQYTSGSTTLPKGVVVSHGNLLHNLQVIKTAFDQSPASETVIWLPPFHDMGLIGGILQPLYTGNPVTLLPHLLFVQRPIRWLQAITRYQATTSGGPNFAYELCLQKVRPEQKELLDLSSWEVAFNGAEPVHHQTLDRFAAYFASCGFRREAFAPCYGLAEATLMVTGGPTNRLPVQQHLLKSGLAENKVILAAEANEQTQTVVSSGRNIGAQSICIVNVETGEVCLPEQIGEIWLQGPSVAKGYWQHPSATAHTFGATLSEGQEGPFLRTGDLGFLLDGELYITGRIKNLILHAGKNHYPHDLERTVQEAHPAVRPQGCAAFSILTEEGEAVVLVVEIQRDFRNEPTAIKRAIRKAIAEIHQLPLSEIILTLPGSIPRTTSGKIKHFRCQENYLSGMFKEIPAR